TPVDQEIGRRGSTCTRGNKGSPHMLVDPADRCRPLRENVAGAGLSLASENVAELNGVSD
ncbi:hypothetical protein ACFU0U_09515, partial [Streptomyces sp. NPDC057418]